VVSIPRLNKANKSLYEQKEKETTYNNHIEEYFDGKDGNRTNELFTLKEAEELDFKTDLSEEEIKIITGLVYADKYLEEHHIKKVFEKYYNKYLRLRVSKERLGRSEFVKMNSKEDSDELLNRLGNASTIISARK
jgi:hypothetical protein